MPVHSSKLYRFTHQDLHHGLLGLFRVGGEFALVGMVIRGRLAAKEHPEDIRGIDLTDSARLVGEFIGDRLACYQPSQGGTAFANAWSPVANHEGNSNILMSVDGHAEGAKGNSS